MKSDYISSCTDQLAVDAAGDPAPKPALRKVAWVNIWNRIASYHHETPGRIHLTASAGKAGRTLCGREFPADKGFPTAFRYCKRCVKKAYEMGYPEGFTKGMKWNE